MDEGAGGGVDALTPMNDPHQKLNWVQKYIFSVDHKVIGLQYALTAMVFLLFGFGLMMLMRWQLAFPGEPLPLLGGLFSDTTMPGGVMLQIGIHYTDVLEYLIGPVTAVSAPLASTWT